MIHFIVGKPRNGKSLYAVGKIVEQLTKTQRYIVTNMVLRLDELQDYLDSLGHNVHVADRVRMLDDDETRNFWLYREAEYMLPVPANYNEKNADNVSYCPLYEDSRFRVGGQLSKPDGSAADFKGTCYVIDEVQNIWRARGWQGTPIHVDFYLTQHGKLNDLVYFITQNVKNVDRLLYSVAQDFTYCRNHRIEKHGRFRGEDKFVAKTYPGPVTTGNEVTLNVQEYKLDLALAACYDTSAGVGMPGGGTADAGARAKGIPLKTVWIGLGSVLAACWAFFTFGLPHLTNRLLSPVVDPRGAAAHRTSGAAVGEVSNPDVTECVPATPIDKGAPPPDLVAFWVSNGAWGPIIHATLSNGVTIPPREIQAYNMSEGEEWVRWQGRRFSMTKRSFVSYAQPSRRPADQ